MHDGDMHLLLSDLARVGAVCSTPVIPDGRDDSIVLVPHSTAPSLIQAQATSDEATRYKKSAPADLESGDWTSYCAAAPSLEPQALDVAMLDLRRRLGELTRSTAFAAALQVVAGTKTQFFSTQTQPLSLFERCRKTASHAGETASISASCDPGNFPYSIAWFAYLLFLGVRFLSFQTIGENCVFMPATTCRAAANAGLRVSSPRRRRRSSMATSNAAGSRGGAAAQ